MATQASFGLAVTDDDGLLQPQTTCVIMMTGPCSSVLTRMIRGMLPAVEHGYTNQTVLKGRAVQKTYAGPDAQPRQAAEHRALTSLEGHFPVPRVTATGPGWISTRFIDGVHGQDLVAAGHAVHVLTECGRLLRWLHALEPQLVDPSAADDTVIQHGDFGPNNMLFGTDGKTVAVLDWEFSTTGRAITDLAWCEWVIRMHHPEVIPDLIAFFDAYGSRPPWSVRHTEMIRRCRWLEDFTRRWDPTGPGVTVWQQRTRVVQGWNE